MRMMQSVNEMIMEGVRQSHVIHEHNTHLIDIAMLDSGPGGFQLALVMERLAKDVSSDIEERQRENRPYTERELYVFLAHTASGLVQAKKKVKITQKIAHCDIKPQNIFITKDGNYKIGDFGNAWTKAQQLGVATVDAEGLVIKPAETTVHGVGTLEYISNEVRKVLAGEDANFNPFLSDIYSLGITLLHMAKLQRPETLDTVDTDKSTKMVDIEVEAMQSSDGMKDLVRRMLSADPAERPIADELKLAAAKELGEDTQWRTNEVWWNMTPEQLEMEARKTKAYIEKLENERQGEEHVSTAVSYIILAQIYEAMGQLPEAAEMARKCLNIALKVMGEEHASTAASYNTLADIYQVMGQLPEAAEMARNGLSIALTVLGEEHDSTAISYNTLAQIYYAMGNLAAARENGVTALRRARKTLGESHPITLDIANNLADVESSAAKKEAVEANQCQREPSVPKVESSKAIEKPPKRNWKFRSLASLSAAPSSNFFHRNRFT